MEADHRGGDLPITPSRKGDYSPGPRQNPDPGLETSLDIPEGHYYHNLYKISGSGILPERIETGAYHHPPQTRQAGLLRAGGVPSDLPAQYTGKAARSRHGLKTLVLGREIQAAS